MQISLWRKNYSYILIVWIPIKPVSMEINMDVPHQTKNRSSLSISSIIPDVYGEDFY